MEVTRKIFYNKRNGQASITLPSKELKKLQEQLKMSKPLSKVSLKITSPKGFKDYNSKVG